MDSIRYIACLLTIAFSISLASAEDKPIPVSTPGAYNGTTPKTEEIPAYLQDISVTIHAGIAQGSGVIKTRDGINYVLTAGHVVSHLRKTREFVDPKTGTKKTKIEFDDAKIVKELYQDGRSVGRLEIDAEVIRYSDADNGEDLALLRVRKKNFIQSSVQFYCGETTPGINTHLLHVGSLLGQTGSNSLTSGIVSQIGRVRHDKVYDQSTCAAFPGSSGGGLFIESNGQYVGMIVRGAGETFNLYVPVRRIREWAKRANVEFVIDDKLAVPNEKTLKSTPIEEVGAADYNAATSAEKIPYPHDKNGFLIKINKPETKHIIHLEW